MSTLPYVAPWQTQFTRYSTQLYSMSANGISRELTIPSLQWWRIGYASARYNTSADAGGRQITFDIGTPGGTTGLTIAAPISQGAGATGLYTVAPNVSAFGSNVSTFATVAVWSIPDLLWGPGTKFTFTDLNNQTGDTFAFLPTLAAEVYTEDYNSAGQAVLTPAATPLLV